MAHQKSDFVKIVSSETQGTSESLSEHGNGKFYMNFGEKIEKTKTSGTMKK